MDKDDKKQQEPALETPLHASGAASGAFGEVYAPKRTSDDHDSQPVGLSQEAWDTSYRRMPFGSTPQERLAIRTFSRGAMGAIFFAAGGMWARKLMQQLDNTQLAYNADKEFTQILKEKNPLQLIAKTIDTVVGQPIRAGADAMGYNGLRLTHFKPTKYWTKYTSLEIPGGGPNSNMVRGRSLGEEVVFATFDFFCASVGDAIGRDMVGWFDPAVKKKWLDDNGNINVPEALKSLGKNMFRYVTYNGGEDWAVAIPYVFFIKGQRKLIDYMSPGYAFESDIAMNAGCLKTNTAVAPHVVTGSYSFEAIMDYQTRFTVYNIGTLMYRELYDKIENAFHGKHVNLYGDPDSEKKDHSLTARVTDIAKWTLRSAIKGTLYMTPAVPLFSITRATQNRDDRALFVDPNTPHGAAAMGFMGNDGNRHFLAAGDMPKPGKSIGTDGVTHSTPVFYSYYDPHGNYNERAGQYLGSIEMIPGSEVDAIKGNPAARPGFDAYHRRNNMIENGLSIIGRANSDLAKKAENFAANHLENQPFTNALKQSLGLFTTPPVPGVSKRTYAPDKMSRFARGVVNASVSYTPYMYAKAEFANLWDNGKTDLAAERLIDGAFTANLSEIRAGMGELWNAVLHKPFADAQREKEAQRRIIVDSSASDDFTDADARASHQRMLAHQERYRKTVEATQDTDQRFTDTIQSRTQEAKTPHAAQAPQNHGLSWRERFIKGPDIEDTVQAITTKHTPASKTEQEEMRKALEESTPLNHLPL